MCFRCATVIHNFQRLYFIYSYKILVIFSVLCSISLQLVYFVCQFSSVQSVVFDSLQPHGRQASLSITNSRNLLRLMSIKLVMPSNQLILCRPLLLLSSNFPSIRVFSNESALCMRWTKYWSFSFSISPSNEHPGLISFRMDWLDLLAVQGPQAKVKNKHL